MKIVDPKYRAGFLKGAPLYHILTVLSILAAVYYPLSLITFIHWNYLWAIPLVMCLFLPYGNLSIEKTRFTFSNWLFKIIAIVIGSIFIFWTCHWCFWYYYSNGIFTTTMTSDFFNRMLLPQGLFPWVLWSLLTTIFSYHFAKTKEPRYVDACAPLSETLRKNVITSGSVQGTIIFGGTIFALVLITLFSMSMTLWIQHLFHLPFNRDMTLSAFFIFMVFLGIPNIKLLQKLYRKLTNKKFPLGYYYFCFSLFLIALLLVLNSVIYGMTFLMPPETLKVTPPEVLNNSLEEVGLTYHIMFWAWQLAWAPLAATLTAKYSYDRHPRTILAVTMLVPLFLLLLNQTGFSSFLVSNFTYLPVVFAILGFILFCLPMVLMKASGFDMMNFLLTETKQRFRPNQYLRTMSSFIFLFVGTLITFGLYPLRFMAVAPALALCIVFLLLFLAHVKSVMCKK